MSPRCSMYVFDSSKRRYRKCKNSTCIWTEYCYTHIKYDAIFIQSIWRGYRTRKKINVFKNLPTELWDHILYYKREEIRKIKLYKSILKIYNNKARRIYVSPLRTTTEYYKSIETLNNYLNIIWAIEKYVYGYSNVYARMNIATLRVMFLDI